MKKLVLTCLFATCAVATTSAHAAMEGMNMDMDMNSSVDLNDPMNREGSGTSWVPDSTPIYARMLMTDHGMVMLHGGIFPRYTRIGGDRDVSASGDGGRVRLDAPSMFMGMYSLPVGDRAQLGFHLMTSLDPLIERSEGYPLLYQSGETHNNVALHDRQHPHDLVSELSATYSQKIGETQSAYAYVGYPGEPALGPPAFMHRLSAMNSADAPIGHHWEDATHISWGVTTVGYSLGSIKAEASAFRGGEPDENRYNFEDPRLDSWSARLSWNPTANLALQVSHGRLHAPETLEPDTNLRRSTASLLWSLPMGDDANWSNSLVFGQNRVDGDGASDAWLLESALQRGAHSIYTRIERVEKSAHELDLPGHELYPLISASLGYVHDFMRDNGLDIGLGAQVGLGRNPEGLDPVYGNGTHWNGQVFLRIRPSRL